MSRTSSHHAEWLGLIEVSGPFLSLPVLERVFPQGLDAHDPGHSAKLRIAREEWASEQERATPDPELQTLWVELVLTETLQYTPEVLHTGSSLGDEFAVRVEEHDEVLRPDFVLTSPDAEPSIGSTRLLIGVYPPDQDLEESVDNAPWAASAITRTSHLCRALGVRLGLVTNGERWVLVDAPPGETVAHVSWYASLWNLEPLTLRAFRSLLGVRRFFGVADSETLEGLLAESATYQGEVTELLGAQVRRAVEVLIQSLDRADADSGRHLLTNVTESELYEAALTVMMRLVFLFFAEENGLLPLGDRLYQENYAASTLQGQLREEADRVGVEVLERRQDAWTRLLATFRAIYGGIEHEALLLPAYGGSLFDPDRFCFLEGRLPSTTWRETMAQPLPVDNRTVLHLLDALQVLQMRGRTGFEARKLSFRGLDIEQIGHVYEMLLDHEVRRADSPTLGLVGRSGQEPEVTLERLTELRDQDSDQLLDFLQQETGKSNAALGKLLGKEPDEGWVERLRTVCHGDSTLLDSVLPYHGLIRTDPWGEPIVIQAGSVFVTGGPERRATGTYYTPRALTEEVVAHALEPLVYDGPAQGKPRDEWILKNPHDLLDLRVCDPAMGSGAFLVQVVRWCAERLVEAWEKAEEASGSITLEGDAVGGEASEFVVPTVPEERAALARRVVADRCIYGVDVNPLAVEMAKLSLWLVTLAKGRPFSFLDHALKCGDSLLGVQELDQIRHFHVDPARGKKLYATLFDPTLHIEQVVQGALELRRELESFTVRNVHDADQKSELNHRADAALNRLRLLGDLVIGAAISTSSEGSAELDKKLQTLSDRLPSMLEAPGVEADKVLRAAAVAMLNKGKPALKPDRRTFHWPLEFPEVFLRERPGFDAFVGNPPFQGGQKISGALGSTYREHLIEHIANDVRGSADLVAYFFLRASSFVRAQGMVGLLATNTLSQGDTREVGLDQIVANGRQIVRAWKSRPWPGSASVQIALVWFWHGTWMSPSFLDGAEVVGINSWLDPVSRVKGHPQRLPSNARKCFQGSIVLGKGFVLTSDEVRDLVRKDARNADVLFPYLGGEDLNSSPEQTPSRWVINFFDWSLEKAQAYPDCLSIVRELVKPERDQNKRAARRERWWQYGERAAGLYSQIQNMDRVIAITLVSSTLTPAFVKTGIVFSHKVAVFAYDDFANFSVLSSNVHRSWASKYSSTLGVGINYSPSDCFETFPLPEPTEHLSKIGKALDEHRQALMVGREEGLTKSYNRVHDPDELASDVLRLRELHVELDNAVAAAYGWEDLELTHDFCETPQGIRYTLGPVVRTEVLDRLLELNHERLAAENQQLSLGALS